MSVALDILGSAPSTMSAWSSLPRGAPDVQKPDASRRFTDFLQSRANEHDSTDARARRAAEEFVAIALVQPLLKQLRDSSMAAPPFAPTQGEQQFQSLYDAEIARRLVSAKNFPLVDRLAADLAKGGKSEAGERLESEI